MRSATLLRAGGPPFSLQGGSCSTSWGTISMPGKELLNFLVRLFHSRGALTPPLVVHCGTKAKGKRAMRSASLLRASGQPFHATEGLTPLLGAPFLFQGRSYSTSWGDFSIPGKHLLHVWVSIVVRKQLFLNVRFGRKRVSWPTAQQAK